MATLPMQRNRMQQAQWVLGQLLEWHRREDKVDWWEFFRLNDMAEDELLDERAGLAGLTVRNPSGDNEARRRGRSLPLPATGHRL